MPNAELASWMVVGVAVAVLAGFVLVEWLRHVHRDRNLGRVLADIGSEQRVLSRPGEASNARGADIPRPSAIPPVPRARTAPSPGTVAGGTR